MKKVFKYATGQEVPTRAVYLTTLVEDTHGIRLVWHYFLVEVKE